MLVPRKRKKNAGTSRNEEKRFREKGELSEEKRKKERRGKVEIPNGPALLLLTGTRAVGWDTGWAWCW